MKITLPSLLLGLLLTFGSIAAFAAQEPSDIKPARPAILNQALQMLLVSSSDWTSVPGEMQRYQRKTSNSPWEAVGAAVLVGLGRNGMAPSAQVYGDTPTETPFKKEGDGKSPAGAFLLPLVFAYAPEEAQTSMPVLPVTEDLVCVDDSASRHYNTLVSQRSVEKDWNSAEQMLRPDGLYRFGILAAYNTDPVQPGAGSCIFLHLEIGPQHSTSGCTGMPPEAMHELLHWLDPSLHPVLVQLPAEEYQRVRALWGLP